MQTKEFIGTKFADWFGAFYAPAVVEPTAQEKIERIEAEIAAMPQAELVTVHHFAPGMYARELQIPAGVVLTGKIHLTEHINTISAGRIMVYTEDGGAREICAPCTIVSKPGTKRVGIALEDTVWTCYHATNETDLDRLEAELVTDSFAAYRARMIEV